MERSAGEQAMQILQLLGEILIVIIKMIYFTLESLYRKVVPATEVSVKGEVVLVTGAGHGIGKQYALQYASHGATVVAWDINLENMNATIKEIAKKGYPKAYAYVCDVSSREAVIKTVEQVQKDVGDINIIVNNAGIMPCHPLLEHTQQEIERIMGINVLAHMWIIQAILPSMIKNRRGHILAMASCAGIMGIENIVPYCASKFAVVGMMEALYQELKFYKNCDIKITVICPYMVDTGLCKKPKIRFEALMPMLPPEEVAAIGISSQRRGIKAATVPGYIYYLNQILRCGALKSADVLKDFLGATLDSDK